MAISTTGRVIKVNKKSNIKKMSLLKGQTDPLQYNHIRVMFNDGSERHMLFTDVQIKRGIKQANTQLKEAPKTTWVHELWYEGFIDTGVKDIEEDIEEKNLPPEAKKYNHIRVHVEDGDEMHLLFEDKDIRLGLSRAQNNKVKLPKLSWLSDELELTNE